MLSRNKGETYERVCVRRERARRERGRYQMVLHTDRNSMLIKEISEVEIGACIGEGNFGQVYKGMYVYVYVWCE